MPNILIQNIFAINFVLKIETIMPIIRELGKDKVIFATKEEHSEPSTVSLPQEEPPPGLILSDGSINWNCPCLGGMATGPCGVEFREAFSCFHYSEAEPKGSDCYDAFKTMQDCMAQYPALYNKDDDNNDDLDDITSQSLEAKSDSIAADPVAASSTSAADTSKKS